MHLIMFPRNFKRLLYFFIWGLSCFICGRYFSTIRSVEEALPCHSFDSQIAEPFDAGNFNRIRSDVKHRVLNSASVSAFAPRHIVLKYSDEYNYIHNASNLLCSHFCVCNTRLKQFQNSCFQLDYASTKNSNFFLNL